MKKFFITLVLLAGAICQAVAATADQTPEYKYFYLPLSTLLQQDPQAAGALAAAARPLQENEDYAALLANAQVVLLGEIHNKEIISREINVVLRRLAKNTSLGFTHMATEFLLQSSQKAFDAIANKQIPTAYLAKQINADITEYKNGLITMQVADGLGLKVVGLDIDEVLKSGGTAWALTDEGLKTRNVAWFGKMAEILKQNPSARFIVHCGALHSQYIANSLSSLLRRNGIKTKVVLFELGPDPASERQFSCQYFQNPQAVPSFIWYQLFCRYGMERQNLLIKVPARYVNIVGADVVVYFGNPNPLIKAKPEEKRRLIEELGYLNNTDCRMHPDSTACQSLRSFTFRP